MKTEVLVAALSLPLAGQVSPPQRADLKPRLIEWAEKALVMKPKNAEVLADCGRAFLAAGQRAKAGELFDLAIVADGENPEILRVIAESWLKFGDQDKALTLIRGAVAKWPDDDDMITAFACSLTDAKLAQEADATMRRALAASADGWRNFVAYGRACLRAGRAEAAAEWFERAVKAEPKDAEVWRALALAFALRGADPEVSR